MDLVEVNPVSLLLLSKRTPARRQQLAMVLTLRKPLGGLRQVLSPFRAPKESKPNKLKPLLSGIAVGNGHWCPVFALN